MSYMAYDEIVTAIQQLCEEYPTFTQLVRLPNLTAESRVSYAVVIGAALEPEKRTAVIVGGVHAREWIPPDALLYFCADLLEAIDRNTGLRYGSVYFQKDLIAQIFTDLQLVIFPCANPDGRVYSQSIDPDWRKNRSPHTNANGSICYGVDLNRNFDVAWDFKRHFAPSSVSASNDPCNKYLYVGPEEASESETKNIVWLLDHFVNTGWYIDIHSYVPAIFHSWGLDENQVEDSELNFLNPAHDGKRGIAGDDIYKEYIDENDLNEVKRLSGLMGETIRLVHGDVYEISPAFSLYATSGASDDYAYSRHRTDSSKSKILSFTMECAHEFQPDWPIAENVIREVSASLISFAVEIS